MNYIPIRPIPIKDRASILFLEYGELDIVNGALALNDKLGARMQIPVGGLTCLMLEPGIRITHAAVKLAADVGCLLLWVGEGGVRLYAAGQPGGARSDRLRYQVKLTLDDSARLRVVREMYRIRFGDASPSRWSIEQLRGLEGSRVREQYRTIAKSYGIEWNGRRFDVKNWRNADLPNQCLNAATACLYGLSEAAILAAGYSPAVGFLHTGKDRSFAFDIADLFKFETVVPAAFATAAAIGQGGGDGSPVERQVRLACRNYFRRTGLLDRIIPTITEVLDAGGLEPPPEIPEAMPVAFEEEGTAE